MFTSWFNKQADRWLHDALHGEEWYIGVLRDEGYLPGHGPESLWELREFVLKVIKEAREAEKEKP